MFAKHIKKTKELNRIDLSLVKGKRLYYNKTRNIVSICVASVFYLIFAISLASFSNAKEPMWLVFACLTVVIMVFYILEIISMLLLKNPVFILQGEQIYYIRTNEWYPIMEHDFRDKKIGKLDYYETFCMYNRKDQLVLKEKNWYLKGEEEFKSHIKYNKLILSRG